MAETSLDVLIGGKKLSELKVTELKSELDKRGLQKAGVKSVLMDRLRRAVLREGNSDDANVHDETDEINVEELSEGENSVEREDAGDTPSARKTPRNLRTTPGGDRVGSVDPSADDEGAGGGSDLEVENNEAPLPPSEVTLETNEPANDSEQRKVRGPGRSRRLHPSKDASLVETPQSGSKEESRSPSQQAPETHEKSDQEMNSQETGEKEQKVKRGPGRPRKNHPKESPVPATPKSATKAVESSKKVVGSARRKSAPPTKMPVVKTEISNDAALSSGNDARSVASKPGTKTDVHVNEGSAAAASCVAQPRTRHQEAVLLDFKKDDIAGDFAEKTCVGESEDKQELDGDGLLDQHEAVPQYDLDRSAKAILDVPMEIASPIESEEEDLLLDTSDDFGGKSGKAEREDLSDDSVKLREDVDERKEKGWGPDSSGRSEDKENRQKHGRSSGSLDRNESISSVQIDPSYQPDAEELLYEGDVETEARLAKAESAARDGDGEEEGDARDDCFVFDVTGENMELDVHPLEKPEEDGDHKAEASDQVVATAPSSAPPKSEAAGGGSLEQERSPQCHLWVSGLASTVSALDLQTLFSTVGQVISAKIVARAQSKHHRFGYVTLATPEQASLCISKLNDTELKGRRITVESKTPQPNSFGHRGDKQPPDAAQGQPGSQARSAEENERTLPAPTGTEPGSKSASSSKRLMVVDKGDGKKILRVNRKESQDSSSRPRGYSRERRRSSPHQRSPVRKGSPRRPRSPPGSGRVVSRLEPRRGEPSRRVGEHPPYRHVEHRSSMNVRLEERRLADDRRQEMMVRRQLEIEHSRREQEMLRRLQETHEREARERAIIRERELAEIERRFQERERELREKEARERQRREVLERELRERDARERELRDKERRLREMRDQHEKELRERELKLQREMEREKEMRERAQAEKEKQLKEQERKLREEKEKLEKEKVERERRERERRAEEQRLREEKAKEEQKEQERRLKEEKERLEQERKLKEEKERIERERREHAEQEQRKRVGVTGGRDQKTDREQPSPAAARQQSTPAVQAQRQSQSTPQAQRPSQPPAQAPRPTQAPAQTPRPTQAPAQAQRPLQAPPPQPQVQRPPQSRTTMKRPFSDSDAYNSSMKRPTLHDVRNDSYTGPSSVFNRLEPAGGVPSDRGAANMMPIRPESGSSSGYPQQLSGELNYRLGQAAPPGGSGYPLPQTHGTMMDAAKSVFPSSFVGGAKAHMTQEQLYAVSEAMESYRNSSYSQAGRLGQSYMPVPGVGGGGGQMMGMNYHRGGGVPDMSSHSSSMGRQQQMMSSGSIKHKLPPEDERYNKRLSRPPPGRPSASFNKRLA